MTQGKNSCVTKRHVCKLNKHISVDKPIVAKYVDVPFQSKYLISSIV